MLKNISFLLILLYTFILSGCATNAGINQMTYSNNGMENKNPKNSQLLHNISVDQVTGGHETNPLWTSQINNENFKEALKLSLQQADLYTRFADSRSKYKLDAELVSLKQPLVGLNLTVNCEVQYSLKDNKINKIIYNKNIVTSHTATVADSFVAVDRLKKANEGAAKKNIQQLINDLYKLPVS